MIETASKKSNKKPLSDEPLERKKKIETASKKSNKKPLSDELREAYCLSRGEVILLLLIYQAVSIFEAFSRPSILTASSLILNFRILPAAFIGNASTNAT